MSPIHVCESREVIILDEKREGGWVIQTMWRQGREEGSVREEKASVKFINNSFEIVATERDL